MHQQITSCRALSAAAASPWVQASSGLMAAGSQAINPATGELVPIWVADYVLGNYGSGAIMAVPAHDTRDHAFAQQYGLPALQVVKASATEAEQQTPFTGTTPSCVCYSQEAMQSSSKFVVMLMLCCLWHMTP